MRLLLATIVIFGAPAAAQIVPGPELPPAPTYTPRGEQFLIARIKIDAKGRITKCKMDVSSGSASVDAKACSLLRSGTTEPKLDAAGKPVESETTAPMRYVNGKLLPLPVLKPIGSAAPQRR